MPYHLLLILFLEISPGRLVLILTMHIIVSLAIFIAVIAVLVFLIRGFVRRYKPLDIAVFERMKSWPNPGRNKVMLAITFLGKHQFLIPANLVLIFYFLWVAKQTWLSIRVLAVSLSSLVLMLLLKALFGRARPLSPLLKAARGLSFPSGHALMSVAFFGIIIYWVLHAGLPDWITIVIATLLTVLILLIALAVVGDESERMYQNHTPKIYESLITLL